MFLDSALIGTQLHHRISTSCSSVYFKGYAGNSLKSVENYINIFRDAPKRFGDHLGNAKKVTESLLGSALRVQEI
jgi:hypothetical protein